MMKRCLLFMLILLVGCDAFKKGNIAERPPKPLEEKAFDIFLVLDQSGSILTTDAQELRIQAAKYFVDYFASFSRQDSQNRIGLVNFGTEAPEGIQFK